MKNFNLPESSIKQAIANTQIIDEFYVKETQNVKDSVQYLVQLTKNLIDLYSVNISHVYHNRFNNLETSFVLSGLYFEWMP